MYLSDTSFTMPKNRSRYAILGALTIRPMSGYDIRQFFSQSVSHFWDESYGQIYPILKGLHSEGLVSQVKRPRDSRRVAYRITPQGRAALADWLSETVDPIPGRTEILLKLFFVRNAPPNTASKLITHYREKHEELLALYTRMSKDLAAKHAGDPNLPGWLTTLSFGSHVSRALLEWCDEAEKSFRRRQTKQSRG